MLVNHGPSQQSSKEEYKPHEQCSEIEENLKKNNSKRAYELVKDLTTVKQGKVTTVQDRSGKCLTRRATDTEPMDRILL